MKYYYYTVWSSGKIGWIVFLEPDAAKGLSIALDGFVVGPFKSYEAADKSAKDRESLTIVKFTIYPTLREEIAETVLNTMREGGRVDVNEAIAEAVYNQIREEIIAEVEEAKKCISFIN